MNPQPWEELLTALRIIPGSAGGLFPSLNKELLLRKAEVGLKVTLAGRESAAAPGSSRTDGDLYISNKWQESSKLLFPTLLGTMSSWRGDIHLAAGQHHGINTWRRTSDPSSASDTK